MQRFRGVSTFWPGLAARRPPRNWDDSEWIETTGEGQRAPRIARGVVTGVAILLFFAASGMLLAQQNYEGTIYPAVVAGDLELGGLSLPGARSVLQAEAAVVEAQTVTFTHGDNVWTPSFRDLGISIDVERTLDGAYGVGREATARTRISNLTGLLRGDHVVPLIVVVDHRQLSVWFDSVDTDIGLLPHDAYLRIDGANVTIEPEVDGTVVDRDALVALVTAGARDLFIADGELPVVATIARVRVSDLENAREMVSGALSKPVKLKLDGKKWTLEPGQMAPFISQLVDPGKRGTDAFSVEIDENQLAAYLDELLAGDINRDPVDAKVAWSNDRSGLIAIEPSQEGAKLRPLTLARAVIESFWSTHSTVEIPITVVKPAIESDNLDALGITTRLAVGDSSYVGSNGGRSTNIVVGASLLNGTLIPPHGVFTFNHAIGVIEESKGYVEASVISGERIGRDVGGGICQVSTTVFRAALLAGLPIVEWWPHTYRLGFYELDGWPPGFDASILQPNDDPFSGGDFRFENPTDSWMLVESYTADERVYVIIYGERMDYSVTFTEPWISDPIPPPDDDIEIVDDTLAAGTIEQSELAQSGVEVAFERIVTDADGNVVIRDTWHTVFSSRPDVWKVSPDMEGQSPAAYS